MSPLSSVLVLKALDGLTTRQIVTAENIANAATTNYQPLRATFEDALRVAAGKDHGAVLATRAVIERDEASPLRLDLELATASSTAMRYAALIEVLSRQMQMHAIATSGGR